MDLSGDGRWHGHARGRWSGGRAWLLTALQGSGKHAVGQAEPRRGTAVETATLRQDGATTHGKGGLGGGGRKKWNEDEWSPPSPFYKSVGQLIGLWKPKSHYKLNFAIIAKFLTEPLSICKIKNIKI